MMRAPAFWDTPGSLGDTVLGRLLQPFGWVSGRIALARMGAKGGTIDAPVICVGNPTVGGTGKTPVAIALLDMLHQRGARPFALLRGHGGSARAPVVVERRRDGASFVGDEALLLASHARTVVSGSDRLLGARLAREEGATHIVMDDGFQNATLHKDAALLVLDGRGGIGNGRVLPAGPLRAPLAPQLARADALMVVGDGPRGDALAAEAAAAGLRVLRGRLVPDPAAVDALRGRSLYAFAGIGKPEKFFATLRAQGLEVQATRAFPDHHPYRPDEIARLAEAAAGQSARLVTTEKDMVRLEDAAFADWRDAIATLPVRLETDEAALANLIALAQERYRARRA